MSFSSHDVQLQAKHLSKLIAQIPQAAVARVSNKNFVACVADRFMARDLKDLFRAEGFRAEVKRGLKTSRFYVNAAFNAPY